MYVTDLLTLFSECKLERLSRARSLAITRSLASSVVHRHCCPQLPLLCSLATRHSFLCLLSAPLARSSAPVSRRLQVKAVMGAEISKAEVSGMRRVGSSGALDQKTTFQGSELASSASATSLASMVSASAPASGADVARHNNGSFLGSSSADTTTQQRHSQHTSSDSSSGGQKPSKALDTGLFGSLRRSANSNSNSRVTESSRTSPDATGLGEDHAVESLDLPIVEWEGYVTKRGHLVRNWKSRFFTLEGNTVSCTCGGAMLSFVNVVFGFNVARLTVVWFVYVIITRLFPNGTDYESKVDARNRSHLKGRVNVASVKLEKVSKSGHGFDFSFETTEGKVFHCCVPTEMEQLSWVYFLEVRSKSGCCIRNLTWSQRRLTICTHVTRSCL